MSTTPSERATSEESTRISERANADESTMLHERGTRDAHAPKPEPASPLPLEVRLTTPEGKIKKAIKKVLDELGCYYFMPVQTGMGKRTLDFLVCFHGTFLGIEAKAPGEKPTALQKICMREISKAGGSCTVVDSVDCVTHLKVWMNSHLIDKDKTNE